jgi:hypothetical protein
MNRSRFSRRKILTVTMQFECNAKTQAKTGKSHRLTQIHTDEPKEQIGLLSSSFSVRLFEANQN